MNFEHWWVLKEKSFVGSYCDKMIIKSHLKMGWEAHTSESMKPLTNEIIEDAKSIQNDTKNILDNAEMLKTKIEKL
jgi:formyltetrahydrofolate synthetase